MIRALRYALAGLVAASAAVSAAGLPDFDPEGLLRSLSPGEVKVYNEETLMRRGGILPEKVYNFRTLQEALGQGFIPLQDAQEAVRFIPRRIQDKLDDMGVTIVYRESFFMPLGCGLGPDAKAGLYWPGSRKIELGSQGYDEAEELFMEGFILHFYNPGKLRNQDSDLADYVRQALESAQQ